MDFLRSSKPVFEYMEKHLHEENVVHADEMELRVLKRKWRAQHSVSRVRVYCSDKYSEKSVDLYQYRQNRTAKVVD
jgi:hypothetical protein